MSKGPFSLNFLRAFEASARHLSFSEAAAELCVTPAAVSQQIRTLEAQLGVRLFHRSKRDLRLTQAATAGLPELLKGLDSLSAAVEQMRGHEQRRVLIVRAAPSLAAKWLVPRLHRFHAAHPDIDVNLQAETGLIDGPRATPAGTHHTLEPDLEIRFGSGKYPGHRSDKLLSVSAVPLCAPDLCRGERALRRAEDLRHHPLLHDDTSYAGRLDWAAWLAAAGVDGIDVSRGLRFNHVSLALGAALEGQGVVLSLRPLAAADLAAGRLAIPFGPSLPLDNAYYVVTANEAPRQPASSAFRDWLLAEAKNEQAPN